MLLLLLLAPSWGRRVRCVRSAHSDQDLRLVVATGAMAPGHQLQLLVHLQSLAGSLRADQPVQGRVPHGLVMLDDAKASERGRDMRPWLWLQVLPARSQGLRGLHRQGQVVTRLQGGCGRHQAAARWRRVHVLHAWMPAQVARQMDACAAGAGSAARAAAGRALWLHGAEGDFDAGGGGLLLSSLQLRMGVLAVAHRHCACQAQACKWWGQRCQPAPPQLRRGCSRWGRAGSGALWP